MTIDFKALAAAAAEMEDQTETTSGGGFEREIPPAGRAAARFVEYIELGKHERKAFKGKAKDPADSVRLTFELLGTNHVREIEVDGEKRKIANRITIEIPKILNDKAGFSKLFDKMDYGRGNKNMAQMLGDAFLVEVIHNVVGEGDKAKTYANLKTEAGEWTIAAPMIDVFGEDGIPTGAKKQLTVPEAVGQMRMFIWNKPTRATWDSLFIDGEYETKDDKGNTITKSKNFIQSKIKSAVNFKGSELFNMLSGSDAVDAAISGASEETQETTTEETVAETPKPKTKKKESKPAPDAADALADLGLDL